MKPEVSPPFKKNLGFFLVTDMPDSEPYFYSHSFSAYLGGRGIPKPSFPIFLCTLCLCFIFEIRCFIVLEISCNLVNFRGRSFSTGEPALLTSCNIGTYRFGLHSGQNVRLSWQETRISLWLGVDWSFLSRQHVDNGSLFRVRPGQVWFGRIWGIIEGIVTIGVISSQLCRMSF